MKCEVSFLPEVVNIPEVLILRLDDGLQNKPKHVA
jgi:hypothetical protein